jgi:hypothetical protein
MSESVDPLTRLAIKHGTDKFGWHFYTPVYHELLSRRRDESLRVLEIGVGGYGWPNIGGASLAMWSEYFPHARIIGLDVEEKRLDLGPRVALEVGSQTDPEFLLQLNERHGPFDLILDDGSHRPRDMVVSFETLFPVMANGGLYIIEDIQTCFWPAFGGSPAGAGISDLAASLFRCLNHEEIRVANPQANIAPIARCVRSMKALHNLLIIENGDNTAPSTAAYDAQHPLAERAIEAMQRELLDDPTPEGFANLIPLLLRSGGVARARAALEDALTRWPQSPALLGVAVDMASTKEERLALLSRLGSLQEPGCAIVAQAKQAVLEMSQASFSLRYLASHSS